MLTGRRRPVAQLVALVGPSLPFSWAHLSQIATRFSLRKVTSVAPLRSARWRHCRRAKVGSGLAHPLGRCGLVLTRDPGLQVSVVEQEAVGQQEAHAVEEQ